MTKYLIICIILVTMSCRNNSNHYWINCCDDGQYSVDHNGILFLTESANYQSLQTLKDTLGLKQYLTEDELKSAFDTTVEIREFDTIVYYNTELVPWDTLFVNDNFSAELVLLKDNTDNRGYYFQIRTFDKRRKLISIQDFALWADREKKYCSGDFAKEEQTFTVICGDQSSKYNFDGNGKILPIN
jgi:hypothetical protein